MDKDKGLPSLKDKSINLFITDYPFNIDLKKGSTMNKDKVFYKDNKKDIWEFNKEWFLESRRIAKGTIIYSLKKHLPQWIKIEKPRDYVFVVKKNSQSGGSVSHWQRTSILLFYGKFNSKLKEDYFETYAINGFLRDMDLIHPCPLISSFWENLISQLKPTSVLDPFLGSGTTAEVCTKLGIPWIGYEINDVYSQDINKRLKNCKKEPQQVNLEVFTK
jgi:DNA modification methylase